MRVNMITLARIRAGHPCADGWSKLLVGLGYRDGKFDPDRLVTVGDVAKLNGADDAAWCLRFLPPKVRVAAVLPAAKRASIHTKDRRVHDCIATIDRWLAGEASEDDLRQAAGAAAWAEAAWAAAARAAAARAVGAAARAAARAEAARAEAARAGAARAAAARAAARAEAARAAGAAARAAARAEAARAAAAWAAAWPSERAERERQVADFIDMFGVTT